MDGLVEAIVVGLYHIINQIFHTLPLRSQLHADDTLQLFEQYRVQGGACALFWALIICRLLDNCSINMQLLAISGEL